MKKLKASNRGLTFSMMENNDFPIGSHYRYIVDKNNNTIIIIPSEQGNTVSRKKTGDTVKSLFDIRTKEVRTIVSQASYLSLEETEDGIVIFAYQGVNQEEDKVIDITSLIEGKENASHAIFIGNRELKKAAGGSSTSRYADMPYSLQRVYTVLSLFSGAGMLDYPIINHNNRFRIVFAMDYDKAATLSYKENIGIEAECCDIFKFDISELPNADVVIGGPSCKPFSNANRKEKRMEKHEDYNLVDRYIDTISAVKPYIFVLENVPGFIASNNSLENFRSKLKSYKFTWKVITDADIGGYTLRKRLILFGDRIRAKIKFPDKKTLPHKTVREALSKVDESWPNYYDVSLPSPRNIEKMKLIREGENQLSLPINLRTRSVHSNMYRRLKMDKPACSLPNIRKACILHPQHERILSVSECLALSSFEKNFKLLGNLGQKQQEVANGVPSTYGTMIARILEEVLDFFFNKEKLLFN